MMKSLIAGLGLMISVSAVAATKTAPYVVYWGSWSTSAVEGMGEYSRSDARNKVPQAVTQFNLSFANFVKNGESYSLVGSDGFLDSTNATGWKDSAYNVWTGFKFHNPEVKMLVAIGGATYPDIWTKVLTAQSADEIAKGIAKAINTQYPVYHFNSDYSTKLLGHVTLDGVDLDVEGDANGLTEVQAHNVALLITKLREYLPNKLITLTTFSTAADPASCKTMAAPDCSYPYSAHSGEIIPVLTAVGNKIDYVNSMAYDAGKNYNYQISINNFDKYVGADKVLLGLDLENQWAPEGRFLESIDELKKRAEWVKANPTKASGVFVWGIVGNTSAPNYPVNGPNGQFDIVSQIAGGSQPVTLPTQVEFTTGTTFGSKVWIANGDGWYEFDYIAPNSSKIYTTQTSWNIGQLVNKTNLQVRVQLPNQKFLWCNGANGTEAQASANQKFDFNVNKKIKIDVKDQGGVYTLTCTYTNA